MTRWLHALGSFAAVFAIAAAPAQAQLRPDPTPRANTVELGALLGAAFPSDDHELYDPRLGDQVAFNAIALDLGARLSYAPLSFVAIEGEAQLVPSGTDGRGNVIVWGTRLHVVLQMPTRISPFLLAGGGIHGVRSDMDELGSDSDWLGHAGAGVKYYVDDWVVLRLEGRASWAPKAHSIGGLTRHYEALAGVALRFPPDRRELPPPPDLDPDGDGFFGREDACPDEAGEEPDGCPVVGTGIHIHPDDEANTDSDGDGLMDDVDLCRDEPEDFDGFEDIDGCPDPDNDGDGVLDGADECPVEPGPLENRGCPDTDSDGDGVPDRADNCPDEPGMAERHGCLTQQLVIIHETRLELLDKVYFRTGSARVHRRSRPLLDNVGAVLRAHPEISQVRIIGYTDDRGDDDVNRQLSERRAAAVAEYLIADGVAPERLVTEGRGEADPVADNATAEGREQNRRVEFELHTE